MAYVNRKATILCPSKFVQRANAWFSRHFPSWRVTFRVPVTADAKAASEYWISVNCNPRDYAALAKQPGGVADFGAVLYGGSLFSGGVVPKIDDPGVILRKEGLVPLLPASIKSRQNTPRPATNPKPRPTPVEEVPGKTEPGDPVDPEVKPIGMGAA